MSQRATNYCIRTPYEWQLTVEARDGGGVVIVLADAVFLPYYAALDSIPYVLDPSLLNSSALHGASLAQFLARDRPQILARRHGHDHFMVLGGSAWDHSQPPPAEPRLLGTTSLVRLPEFANFTFLAM